MYAEKNGESCHNELPRHFSPLDFRLLFYFVCQQNFKPLSWKLRTFWQFRKRRLTMFYL